MITPSMPGHWLASIKRQHPLGQALTGQASLSFVELADVCDLLSHSLTAQGVRPGDVIAVQVQSAWQLAHLVYASLRLGAVLLPLDPQMGGQRRDRLMADIGCDYLVSDSTVTVPGVRVIAVGELFDSKAAVNVQQKVRPCQPELIQLIIATSGTTGDPKGVMLSGAGLAASVAASEHRLGLAVGDTWVACLPLFHIGGLSILLRCLAAGAQVLLHEGFRAEKVWQQIAAGTVTHISLVPAMLDKLLQQAGELSPPKTLRVVLIGGGPLSSSLAGRAHAAGWPLCVSYGMSETASQFATDAGPDAGRVPGFVGHPLEGYEVAIAADGRIRVRGAAVMAGYANPEGALGIGLDQGWFETGDLGRLDTQGCLTVTGRADDLLVSGGKNIHPIEVEELLLRCPGISSVGVTGRADPVWGMILVALYSGEFSVEQLKLWAADNLPSHLRPREYMQIDQLPLNQMGKLSRSALKQML